MQKIFYFMLVFIGLQLHADDTITVSNQTQRPLWAIVYCVPTAPVIDAEAQGGELYHIGVGDVQQVTRPAKSATCTRHLAFSYNKGDLPSKIPTAVYDTLPSVGIGLTTGKRIFGAFTIKEKDGVLKGAPNLLGEYEAQLLKSSPLIKNNPYKNEIAQVRVGADVHAQEKAFVKAREPKVKAALENFLGKKLNGTYIPKIAFINSGGGARAFISSLGWHVGAQQTGLLDAVMYDIGLSGGSWFVATWAQSGKDPAAFKALMQPIMAKELYPSGKRFASDELKQFFDAVVVREALGQPITLVNPYGALLANRYLSPYGAKRQEVLLSDQAKKVEAAQWPLPILTAADGYSPDYEANRHLVNWFEFTPYEASGVGSWLGNAHIPIWAFGRTFQGTASINKVPQYDLGLIMGICGSAFAFTYRRAYEEIMQGAIENIPFFEPIADNIMDDMIKKIVPDDVQESIVQAATNKRFSVAKVPNFAKDVTGSTVNAQNLKLVDGAFGFNLPAPPALERKADVLIFLDAGDALGPAFELAGKYAQAHSHAFPPIATDGLSGRAVTIFENREDKNTPVVIYMPRTDSSGKLNTHFSTVKFNYSKAEFNLLSGVTEINMKTSKEKIKQALTDLIERHGGFETERAKRAPHMEAPKVAPQAEETAQSEAASAA